MRTVMVVVAAMVLVACGVDKQPGEDPGTGGAAADGTGGIFAQLGTGGAATGVGGAIPTCDDACKAADLWARYVAAVDEARAARAAYDMVWADTVASLDKSRDVGCQGYRPPSTCPLPAATVLANDDPAVKAANAARMSAEQKANDLYDAYRIQATIAGLVPMDKLSLTPP